MFLCHEQIRSTYWQEQQQTLCYLVRWHVLANRFPTGSLVSATSSLLFQVKQPVSDRIALSRHDAIALAGSRQVRCFSDVLVRWTLKNDQTYEPVRHFFDTVIYLFCVMTLCGRRQLRHCLCAVQK